MIFGFSVGEVFCDFAVVLLPDGDDLFDGLPEVICCCLVLAFVDSDVATEKPLSQAGDVQALPDVLLFELPLL